MYTMYKTFCEERNISVIAKEATYRNIFLTDFNLAFHIPKKDQCDLCLKYENSIESEKLNMQKEMELHLRNKELARIKKEEDK